MRFTQSQTDFICRFAPIAIFYYIQVYVNRAGKDDRKGKESRSQGFCRALGW